MFCGYRKVSTPKTTQILQSLQRKTYIKNMACCHKKICGHILQNMELILVYCVKNRQWNFRYEYFVFHLLCKEIWYVGGFLQRQQMIQEQGPLSCITPHHFDFTHYYILTIYIDVHILTMTKNAEKSGLLTFGARNGILNNCIMWTLKANGACFF